ncbi:scyllo-inositol 2-dehydrogenase [Oceanobacillus oncorhynchi subsp. oncorhynchi]|uniref:Gfo/Idh/MocA family oxidoreductase n=1 Tax=Oceanobacillus oncorhynchi TaxID=545501 RepID=UPI0031D524AB
MNKTMNVAIIGLGRLGMVHLNNITSYGKGIRVVAVVDKINARAEEIASEYNIEAFSDSPVDACKNPKVDAVVITTPTDTHGELIIEAAKNKKHIFVEKPISHSLEQTKEILEAVQENNVLCQVGFMRRFHPKFMEAKQKIDQGAIGKPVYLKGFTRDNPPDKYAMSPKRDFLKTSGRIFLDLAIHDFDLARYLLGSEVKALRSSGKIICNPFMEEYGDVDQASTYIEFESGAVADIESSRNSPYGFDSGVEIIGTEGAIQIPTIRDYQVSVLTATDRSELGSIFPANMEQSYLNEMIEFIDTIHNGNESPCSAADGVAALEISEAAQKSMDTGETVLISRKASVQS